MAQTPADLDTSPALNLIPIVEFKEDASNFEDWEHSVSFHLNYHRLDCYIDPIPRIPRDIPLDYAQVVCLRRRRLFAYALIWNSAKAVLPGINRHLKDQLIRNREHDPQVLWEVLHDHRDVIGGIVPLPRRYIRGARQML
ncbi:hypothetical protein QBC32DRAFT_386863 [Pseudoneurospora amorphoporcata]|uniref:Uncharacterized protein n=1 Tax=Pseudoneurospora amorphoporcata TaxID=241081 RepID=A0AAN6SHZ6_9PEZI|nr:hypothetical protein QBC32DRAFT_386863 [Pseudoneurospora amorphoporcata]